MNSSGPSSSNAMNEGGSQYHTPHPSQVPVSNFVSIKLYGQTNYNRWKKQMMCLLEYHDMVGYIDGTIRNPDDGIKEWNKSMDTLVKGWIFATLSEDVLDTVLCFDHADACRVWKSLKDKYNNDGGSQQYNPHLSHLSHVRISNFVSIKLSGETNYDPWEKQIRCLLEYHDLVGYIDGTIKDPDYYYVDDDGDGGGCGGGEEEDEEEDEGEGDTVTDDEDEDEDEDEDGDGDKVKMTTQHKEWNKVKMTTKHKDWNKSMDTLVKGWIFGTLSEQVLGSIENLDNVFSVWKELMNSYDNSIRFWEAKLHTDKVKEGSNLVKYIPLQRAIERGEWNKAQEFFNKDKATLIDKINNFGQTPLHIAVYRRQNHKFVKKLLKKIDPALLPTLVRDEGITALFDAAQVGNIEAAKMLVNKNPSLLFIPADVDGRTEFPVFRALLEYHEETFLYLLEVSNIHRSLSTNKGCKNPFEGIHGVRLLNVAMNRGYLDTAYALICEYPKLVISGHKDDTPLCNMVYNEDLYFSAARYNFYQRFIYSHVPIGEKISGNYNEIPDIENPEQYCTNFILKCKRSCFYPVIERIYSKIWEAALLHVQHIKRLKEDKLKHKKALMILECICEEIGTLNTIVEIRNQLSGAFNTAVLRDNHEVVKMIIRFFPQAIWTKYNNSFISETVAKHRCEMVLNFLDQAYGGSNSMRMHDKDNNNILHMAALLAPTEKLSVVSGAALQMQKEVQWFKRIEKCLVPSDTEERNNKNETPIMMFREMHKNLRKDGEEWMKKTADSYTITAALIITIVFAAAITVPGGNDQNTGIPIYTTNPVFIIFAISDAISLFTSTTSLLLFLSILTARYQEDDFLYKLPKRLIYGLVMLFLSVTSMMVAFGATLYIMFGREKEWMLIPIAALACLPIASYVILQYPLLHELVSSTYGHGIYNKRYDQKNK